MSEPIQFPRIFVVDDEVVIASTLAAILKHSGFDAVSFTDPLQALREAQRNPPDLLLTDVVMPNLSGVDLAIQIRQSCPHCRVLLFSGQAATANLLDVAAQSGHKFQVLKKPIHPTDLLKTLRDVTVGSAR